MNNLALCESQSLREEQIEGVSHDKALETLNKAKALVMAVHHGTGVATTEQVAEYYDVSAETIKKILQRHRDELVQDGLRIVQGKTLKEHKYTLSLCDNKARSTIWTPRSTLRCGMLLRDSEVAKQVRTVLLDIAGQKESIHKLEQQFIPDVPLKQLDEYAAIMGKRFGAAYEQQLLMQSIQKFHPHLPIITPKPEESASLETVRALLTATQVAEQVGLFCKSNSKTGDARKINQLLQQLGYQEKVADRWSATDKAIALNLCIRKPVDTGSRTQKDQLFWSVDIVAILEEHVVKTTK
jgi:hypothetical protein